MRRTRGKRSRGVYGGGGIRLCLLLLAGLTAAGVFLLVRREEPPPEPAGIDAPVESESPPEPVPEPEPEPEPDPRQETVEALLRGMSLEEKVGQMFFVRCPDVGAAETVGQYSPGGILLFTRDFKDSAGQWLSLEAFMEKIDALQAASSIPLFIGVDEEGGTVARASRNPNLFPEKFPSPQQVYSRGAEADDPFQAGMEQIRAVETAKNTGLHAYGINVNFAPVADVCTEPGDFMYDRAFGQDAEKTARFVTLVVEEMNSAGVGAVLKHFPGYGSNRDTHDGIAVDERPYEEFAQTDFVPFRAGIEAGAGAVLVSHNMVMCMDDALPASLSAAVHSVLREELAFGGVVLTDDLSMDAVKAYAEDGSLAVLAVQAGNDMLITSDCASQIPLVVEAVQSGAVEQALVDAAVTRILEWKYDLGLLEEQSKG